MGGDRAAEQNPGHLNPLNKKHTRRGTQKNPWDRWGHLAGKTEEKLLKRGVSGESPAKGASAADSRSRVRLGRGNKVEGKLSRTWSPLRKGGEEEEESLSG